MNVEIGTKAAQIPRKGIYINGIFGAVCIDFVVGTSVFMVEN
jgi:hypothetical protein